MKANHWGFTLEHSRPLQFRFDFMPQEVGKQFIQNRPGTRLFCCTVQGEQSLSFSKQIHTTPYQVFEVTGVIN